MRGALISAVYEGSVLHRRHVPRVHAFRYRIAQLYLDLDELQTVFARRWLWSVNRRNLAQWRREDYLGPPDLPLKDAVRACIAAQGARVPEGPIRMLAHLRYAGFIFNPVTFYYCFEADGTTLGCIVAEITNTPWHERHAYVLSLDQARWQDRTWHWCFDKRFHVSPFMAMARDYDWRFTTPDDDLRVHMKVLREGEQEFDATLTMQRRPLHGASLARVLWRYPAMTFQIVGAIYWQALRLWLKRTPVHDHPSHLRSAPDRSGTEPARRQE